MPIEMGLLLGPGQVELPAAFQVACGAAILLFVAALCGAAVLEWAGRRRSLVAQESIQNRGSPALCVDHAAIRTRRRSRSKLARP